MFKQLVGHNDEIADNPSRWGEEMKSWSADELCALVKMTMREAVTEAYEGAATKLDHYAAGLGLLGARGEAVTKAAEMVRDLKSFR